MIDQETKKIINEFMEHIGVPCTDYEKAFRLIIREAIIFALKVHGEEFTTCLGGWEDEA